MKRLFVCLLLMALLLGAATVHAQELIGSSGMYAVVKNPNDADRLNLREKPSTASESLGKYYNGTFVRVLATPKDGWAHVVIGTETGSMEGYMMTKYLNRDPANIGMVATMPVVYTTMYSDLRTCPELGSESIGAVDTYTGLTVLGYTPDWYHVQYGGITAFIPAYDCGFVLGAPTPLQTRTLFDRKHFRTGDQSCYVTVTRKSYHRGDTLSVVVRLPDNDEAKSWTQCVSSVRVCYEGAVANDAYCDWGEFGYNDIPIEFACELFCRETVEQNAQLVIELRSNEEVTVTYTMKL